MKQKLKTARNKKAKQSADDYMKSTQLKMIFLLHVAKYSNVGKLPF